MARGEFEVDVKLTGDLDLPVRSLALQAAVQWRANTTDDTAEQVVASARIFETYLRGPGRVQDTPPDPSVGVRR